MTPAPVRLTKQKQQTNQDTEPLLEFGVTLETSNLSDPLVSTLPRCTQCWGYRNKHSYS